MSNTNETPKEIWIDPPDWSTDHKATPLTAWKLECSTIECPQIPYIRKDIHESEMERVTPKWISVDERMPEVGGKVLVYFGGINNILIGKILTHADKKLWSVFYSDGEYLNASETAEVVTHWMPLPKNQTENKI